MSRWLSGATTRREFLVGLAAAMPASSLLAAAPASPSIPETPFLSASRIITGTPTLSPGIAARIARLLRARDADFDKRLSDLAAALDKTSGDRQARLASLSDAQVGFALEIAKPWYVGYVGKPSDFVLKDDAAFATFLEVQAWQKIIDVVPMPTYPTGNAGWWAAPPEGVRAPTMPAQIAEWTFHPGGPAQIEPPDPAWRSYAEASHADQAAARQAKPGPKS